MDSSLDSSEIADDFFDTDTKKVDGKFYTKQTFEDTKLKLES